MFHKLLGRWDEEKQRNELSKQLFGETKYPIDDFRKDCLKQFTTYLIKDMEGIGNQSWKCDEKETAFTTIPDTKQSKYCDLGLYKNECEKNRIGSAWQVWFKDLPTRCAEARKHKLHTTLEENLLRRCDIEKIK